MKIGLFGGTFDPIHWGHLRSAEEVRETFSLDRVFFVPASDPPHKRRQPITAPRHRIDMVRLAIAKNPRFVLSTLELSRPGKSYSIDTIRHFVRTRPLKKSLYFILGLDAFAEIDSWKDHQEIFRLCHLIVMSRPGWRDSLSLNDIPIAVRKGFCYDPRKRGYRHESGSYLFFSPVTNMAISASEIRGRLKEGRSIRYLVPLEVETYIKKSGLYRGLQEGQRRD